ncbi:MAG: hypothetical protein HY741_16015 [Chloroflexi bacterium]|nr:hypothetical protein [Chloroflexota bacterium]
MTAHPFVPPRDAQFYLLSAHRQPLPANVAAHFIERFTQPGDVVIDPFIASDAVVRVALERGRKILAAESNPIVAWAARVQATMPAAREINAALARLGETRKDSETLRAYIEKLYASQCAQCGDTVIADYFIHRRDGGKTLLAEKIYTCANCGARRDDTTEGDRQRAADAAPRGLTLPLLTQRLYADDPAQTPRLKRLLEFYTPRNLNALAALTQKLDAEFRQEEIRSVLAALLLHALDVGTSLYPAPGEMPTREIPPQFVEANIWRALERAARGLSEHAPALRLASNPAQVLNATTSAACIAQGGARYLAENAAEANAALILSSPARLDPLFWELSFLWTRWLLGKNAAAPLEPLLDTERQRWGWYGGALAKALEETTKFARADARLVVAFPSGSHAMIEALMLSAAPSYALQDFAFRPARGMLNATEFGALRGDYQVVWQRQETAITPETQNALATALREGALRGALALLRTRAEPLAYSWVHHAALAELARGGALAGALTQTYREGDNAFQFLRHRIDEGLKEGYAHAIDHVQEKTRVLWLEREAADAPPGLSERVERVVRELLRERRALSADEFQDAVLENFTALETPEIELPEICARAYADWREEIWEWRASDVRADLSRARTRAAQLGARLGYQVVEDAAPFELVWRVEKIIPASARGSIREERFFDDAYAFIFRARADFQELTTLRAIPLHGLVVIPETQVELTAERLRRDPRWVKKIERAGWDFLRTPMIELLLREDYATRPEFHLAWGLNPPLAEGNEQLGLF